jgi:hypothetical protein
MQNRVRNYAASQVLADQAALGRRNAPRDRKHVTSAHGTEQTLRDVRYKSGTGGQAEVARMADGIRF